MTSEPFWRASVLSHVTGPVYERVGDASEELCREKVRTFLMFRADEESGDSCGCSDADGPCSRHEVDEEGPRGSEAADALRDSQAAAQRSR